MTRSDTVHPAAPTAQGTSWFTLFTAPQPATFWLSGPVLDGVTLAQTVLTGGTPSRRQRGRRV